MPNNYFQFKQFRIEQAGVGQRVSTDACVLGAVADLTGATRVLDLGTGTGLLALMAAQRAPAATVEAVEIDPAAAAVAAANAAASPWAHRVRVHALALADYAATWPATTDDRRFSHLLCNPPFFQRSLRPPDAARATARHAGSASLTFADIADFAAAYLLPAGRLAVLLPPPEMADFARAARQAGLAPLSQLALRHRPGGRVTRCVWEFGPAAPRSPVASHELLIEAAPGDYSPEFRQLLGPFYLHL